MKQPCTVSTTRTGNRLPGNNFSPRNSQVPSIAGRCEIDLIFDHKTFKFKVNERLHIRSVLADSKGRIWLGNNGIGVILKKGDAITHFSKEHGKLIPMNEFEANTKMQQFAKNTGLQSVFAIEEDSEGNIWFGDRDSGAWKYDGKTLTNYKIDLKLNSQMIWSIYEDQNKNLLFGMAEGSVYKFNGKTFDKQF